MTHQSRMFDAHALVGKAHVATARTAPRSTPGITPRRTTRLMAPAVCFVSAMIAGLAVVIAPLALLTPASPYGQTTRIDGPFRSPSVRVPLVVGPPLMTSQWGTMEPDTPWPANSNIDAMPALGTVPAAHLARSADISLPPPQTSEESAPEALGTEASAYVAIIIDDVGHDLRQLDAILALPFPVTLSILPDAPYAQEAALRAQRAGHEVFVHLPMEPEGLADPGPMALVSWLEPDEMAARVERAIAAVPGAAGLNNHMGSRLSACELCMQPVAHIAQAHDLIVVDSLTSPNSRLARVANDAGARTLKRDVFLDHDRQALAITQACAQAETIAQRRGLAVAIGHPYPQTISALEAWMHDASARGVTIGPVGRAPGHQNPGHQNPGHQNPGHQNPGNTHSGNQAPRSQVFGDSAA